MGLLRTTRSWDLGSHNNEPNPWGCQNNYTPRTMAHCLRTMTPWHPGFHNNDTLTLPEQWPTNIQDFRSRTPWLVGIPEQWHIDTQGLGTMIPCLRTMTSWQLRVPEQWPLGCPEQRDPDVRGPRKRIPNPWHSQINGTLPKDKDTLTSRVQEQWQLDPWSY